eukprot:6436025-Prorocentrum_lima.AAC.1
MSLATIASCCLFCFAHIIKVDVQLPPSPSNKSAEQEAEDHFEPRGWPFARGRDQCSHGSAQHTS